MFILVFYARYFGIVKNFEQTFILSNLGARKVSLLGSKTLKRPWFHPSSPLPGTFEGKKKGVLPGRSHFRRKSAKIGDSAFADYRKGKVDRQRDFLQSFIFNITISLRVFVSIAQVGREETSKINFNYGLQVFLSHLEGFLLSLGFRPNAGPPPIVVNHKTTFWPKNCGNKEHWEK